MRHALLTLLCAMLIVVGSALGASAQPPPGRTFEGEPVGQPPAGVTVSGSVLVEDVTVGSATTRAMHVADRSTTQHTRAIVRSAAQPAKHVEFDLLVRDATEPTVVAVHGDGAPGTTGAWRFLLARESAGSTTAIVSVYDSTAWQRLARVPNLLDPNAWQRLAIDVAPDAVVLTAGGLRYKTLVRAAQPTTITDVEFASAGTAPAASSVYVDNLVITGMTATDARLAGAVPTVSPGRIVRAQPQRDVPVATFPATGGPLSAEVDAGSGWAAARVTGPDADDRFTVHATFAIDTPGVHPLSVRVTANGAATVATAWVPVDQFGLVATDPPGTAIRFPDVIRLADGRLLAAYHSAAAHANANGIIKTVTSKDLGRTWSPPKIVWGGEFDNRDPKLAQLSDGTILLTFFQTEWVDGTQRNRGVFVMRWAPRADEFSWPVRIDTPFTPAFSHGAAVELPGGDVLLPLYGNGARVARSTDGGRTFDPAQEIFVARDTATRAYQEPNISPLPSGELVMVIRTHDLVNNRAVNATLSRSADGGATWSSLEDTDYPTSSHHQLALTTDGRVLLTYGDVNAQGARPTRGVMITNPSGPWRGYPSVELYNAGTGFDQANPSSVEVEPSRYLTLGFNVVNRILIGRYSTDATFRVD